MLRQTLADFEFVSISSIHFNSPAAPSIPVKVGGLQEAKTYNYILAVVDQEQLLLLLLYRWYDEFLYDLR